MIRIPRYRLLLGIALLASISVPLFLGGSGALLATLRLPPSAYLAIIGAIALSWSARAIKLLLLLRSLNIRAKWYRVFCVSLAVDVGFMATPAGIGGYAASIYYLQRVGASPAAAAAITAMDQASDVVFFVVAVPLAALTLTQLAFPHLSNAVWSAAGLLVAALTVLYLVWRRAFRDASARWHAVALRMHEFVARTKTELRRIFRGNSFFLSGVAASTAVQQLARYGALWLILVELGERVPFALVFVVQTLAVQAASWTGIPAGGGAAELGLAAGFSQWVPTASMATAILIWRGATLYLCLIVGLAAMAWLSRDAHAKATSDATSLDKPPSPLRGAENSEPSGGMR